MASRKATAYFIGIGGIGMSALARFFDAEGWRIEGSDLSPTPLLDELKKERMRIHLDHKASHIHQRIGMVIYNNAIPRDNPELKRAQDLKLPCYSYPQAVGDITKRLTTIAVAGSHGKSTTTALLALMLVAGRQDPTVLVGTKLKEFGGKNFRNGKKKYFVLEADEFKRAFLEYHPYAAVVTNIDREHLDTYGNLDAVKEAFLKFLANVNPEGFMVLNKDDANLFSLKDKIQHKKVHWVSTQSHSKDALAVKSRIRIFGEHNRSNALLAITAATALGVPEEKCLKALAAYKGSWRRMEYKGVFRGAKVYDDYAHHPTEIQATTQAAKEAYPGKKIWAVFQPHHGERLKRLWNEFVKGFEGLDGLVLLDVYEVAGREERASGANARGGTSTRINSSILADAVRYGGRSPRQVIYTANPKELPNILALNVGRFGKLSDTVILMMGAGNIVEYTKELVE
ncbi:MAG: UDP-N-acetylmuramate--L-alanine ligase [bacterium]|nr:UDP-N-acetylmuramate--L-alanine ligase [bacterium]